MTWILTSEVLKDGERKRPPDAPKFVVPMPDVKSSNLRPLCIVTQDPSPFSNTSSMKRNRPFVTWRCAKSMSGTVVIERRLYLEHEAEICECTTRRSLWGKRCSINNCTHRVWGPNAGEVKVALRSSFHPKNTILRRELVRRKEDHAIDASLKVFLISLGTRKGTNVRSQLGDGRL